MLFFLGLQTTLSRLHIGPTSGWDIFIILVFLIVAWAYGFLLGRNRMVVIILSSYFSLAILRVMPWSKLSQFKWLGINGEPSASAEILFFLGLILLFYFFIPRSILSSAVRLRKRGDASWFQLFLVAILQIGLVAMVILSFLPFSTISEMNIWVKKIFIGPAAEFIWTTLPILSIILLRKPRKIED